MRKWIMALLVLSLSFTMIGCSNKNDIRNDGLEISKLVIDYSEITENESGDAIMSYKYSFSIKNNESYGITIKEIEPIFDDESKIKLVESENILEIREAIKPYGTSTITGVVEFDVTGLGKRTLEKFTPIIKVFRISDERFITLTSE